MLKTWSLLNDIGREENSSPRRSTFAENRHHGVLPRNIESDSREHTSVYVIIPISADTCFLCSRPVPREREKHRIPMRIHIASAEQFRLGVRQPRTKGEERGSRVEGYGFATQ